MVLYAANQGNPDWGLPDGPEQAGPDQCGKVAPYPKANQIETMYPMINPYPWTASYNSPQMAIVLDDADDMAALSSIYPAANYAATHGNPQGLGSSRRMGRANSPASTSSRAASTRATRWTRCRVSRAT